MHNKTRNLCILALLGIILAIPSTDMAAQSLTPEAALAALFARPLTPGEFTKTVLNQVPLSTLQNIVDKISGQLGTFQSVEGNENPYTVVFSGGEAESNIVLDSNGLIAGLNFTRITPKGADLRSLVSKLDSLPGTVAYLVLKDGTTLAEKNANEALAVGSAFKLGVLSALMDQIDSGSLSWKQVVTYNAQWKSLPTGVLQGWPDGSPVTIHSLASLMISISDNTAADTLIHLLGRDAVAQALGIPEPLLTTRELFVLKDPKNAALLHRWRSADRTEKRELLSTLDSLPLPSAAVFAGGPVSIDVEYYVSARKLAALLERTASADLFSINPGVADPSKWKSVQFKGGSEPGVINLSTRLVAEDGTAYTLIVTWNRNDATVDDQELFTIYSGILSSLRRP